MEKKYKWAVKVDGSGCSGPCRRDTCCWTVCVFENKAWRVTWCGAGSRGAEQGSRENGVEAAIQSTDEGFTMGDNLVVCDIDDDVITKINKLRFRKETTNAALVMKVEKQRKTVVLDEEFEDISVEDLKDELPERQPRFVLYSYKYKHDDGRCSFPLCFIFISPQGCKPDLQMMYAGTKNNLVRSAQLTKVFELRSTEEFTESWLKEKLGFFR